MLVNYYPSLDRGAGAHKVLAMCLETRLIAVYFFL